MRYNPCVFVRQGGEDMFQKNEFKAAMARKNITIADIAKALNVNPSTISRKINGLTDFTRGEIDAVSKLLELSPSDVLNIFFAQ